jgi:hypothetical protein
MSDLTKRFELLVLRPLWVAAVAALIFLALRAQWVWLVAPVVAMFFLGVIGSKLHPLQSAKELARRTDNGTCGGS